jgi:hypothetical protein
MLTNSVPVIQTEHNGHGLSLLILVGPELEKSKSCGGHSMTVGCNHLKVCPGVQHGLVTSLSIVKGLFQ